ncbi:MAG: MarR family transcriptional regulator, partial [Rhizobiales bacterium]|nr:MarR family transcriptional regulator [Hyphomicrobiales bacterium]
MSTELIKANGQSRALRLIAMANDLLALARDLELAGDAFPVHSEHSRSAFRMSQDKGSEDQVDKASLGDHPVIAQLARQTYRNRRLRAEIFPHGEFFGEPAWDILLDLFIAAKERRRVSVTSACIGAAVPATTALRWVSILEEQSLLQREADPRDARRVYV